MWKVWEWIVNITSQGFFTFITTVATIFVAVYTGRLVKVTSDLKTATNAATDAANKTADAAQAQLNFTKAANEQNVLIAQNAAKAAAENVEISRLALLENRPYLLLTEQPVLRGFPEIDKFPLPDDYVTTSVYAGARLINFGQGPAVITKIIVDATVLKKTDIPKPRDFSACRDSYITQEVVAPNGSIVAANHFVGSFIAGRQFEAIKSGDLILIFYGRVEYRDVFDNSFLTEFFYTFNPPRVDGFPPRKTGAFFKDADPERNLRT